jgi:hypothetical protein
LKVGVLRQRALEGLLDQVFRVKTTPGAQPAGHGQKTGPVTPDERLEVAPIPVEEVGHDAPRSRYWWFP